MRPACKYAEMLDETSPPVQPILQAYTSTKLGVNSFTRESELVPAALRHVVSFERISNARADGTLRTFFPAVHHLQGANVSRQVCPPLGTRRINHKPRNEPAVVGSRQYSLKEVVICADRRH
jgi:hypothetical protein